MEGAVEVVARGPEGLGFFLKVHPSGRLFRVAPSRDPRQPRYWCLVVYRVTPGGGPYPDERAGSGWGGTRREELPATLAAIRADVGAWLARDECRELRHWLLAADPDAPRPTGSGDGRAQTASLEPLAGRVAPG